MTSLIAIAHTARTGMRLAVLSLLGACSAVGLGSGDERLHVRLYDAQSKVRLELSNDSNPELAGVYSQEKPDASLKLAPDELMHELLENLDKLDFQALSAPGVPPAGGVRGWVEVRRGGASRTFAVPETAPTGDQIEAFVSMKLTINQYYTSIGGLQFIDNPQGADLLRNSQYRGGK